MLATVRRVKKVIINPSVRRDWASRMIENKVYTVQGDMNRIDAIQISTGAELQHPSLLEEINHIPRTLMRVATKSGISQREEIKRDV